jgi:hypothetical protein
MSQLMGNKTMQRRSAPISTAASKPWAVTVLDWPEEAAEAEALAATGALRLLLVAPGVAPPVDWDLTSDWLRRPAPAMDVLARIETMQRRAESDERPPHLDDDGLLWRGLDWVALGPIEVRLVAVLLAHMNRVVSRTELVSAGWPGSPNGTRTLDARVQRLRRRLQRLGLSIGTVRQRGFVLSYASDTP